MKDIPFNIPYLTGAEFEFMNEVIKRQQLSGGGEFTSRCEKLICHEIGVPRTLLTTSCTDALEMAALLLDIRPGDEVILPSFTFPSTANAFALRGGKVVFCDIDSTTLNIDVQLLPKLINAKTKAVAVVHYNGVACDMTAISKLAKEHSFAVVEDAAHTAFSRVGNKALGSFGDFGALSFHETKTFCSGEGGALLVGNEKYIERAEILRDKGTNRNLFKQGKVDKYTWVDLGSSFLPSELLAAFLWAQLEARDTILKKRGSIWGQYYCELKAWALKNGVQLPYLASDVTNAHHVFYLILPSEQIREQLIRHLKKHGISALFHYQPLHTSAMGRKVGILKEPCPVSESVSERLVRLPLYNGMSQMELERVIASVLNFKPSSGKAKIPTAISKRSPNTEANLFT